MAAAVGEELASAYRSWSDLNRFRLFAFLVIALYYLASRLRGFAFTVMLPWWHDLREFYTAVRDVSQAISSQSPYLNSPHFTNRVEKKTIIGKLSGKSSPINELINKNLPCSLISITRWCKSQINVFIFNYIKTEFCYRSSVSPSETIWCFKDMGYLIEQEDCYCQTWWQGALISRAMCCCKGLEDLSLLHHSRAIHNCLGKLTGCNLWLTDKSCLAQRTC